MLGSKIPSSSVLGTFCVVALGTLIIAPPALAEQVTFTIDAAASDLMVSYVVPILSSTLDLVAVHDLSGTIEADVQIAEAGGTSVFQPTLGGAIAFSDEFSTDSFLSNTLSIQTVGMLGSLVGNPAMGSGGPTNYVFDLGNSVIGFDQGLLEIMGSGTTLGPIDETLDLSVDSFSFVLTSPTTTNLTAIDLGNGSYDLSVVIPISEVRMVTASESPIGRAFTQQLSGQIAGHGVLVLPEPSAEALLIAGMGGLLVLERRRSSRSSAG